MRRRTQCRRVYLTSHDSSAFWLVRTWSHYFNVTKCYTDTEEGVVAKVLEALAELSGLGLFQKIRIWELMSAVLGFLYHPNVWIRQGEFFL